MFLAQNKEMFRICGKEISRVFGIINADSDQMFRVFGPNNPKFRVPFRHAAPLAPNFS